MGLINNRWPKEWSPDSLVAAVQTGNRATIDPSTARDEYRALRRGSELARALSARLVVVASGPDRAAEPVELSPLDNPVVGGQVPMLTSSMSALMPWSMG